MLGGMRNHRIVTAVISAAGIGLAGLTGTGIAWADPVEDEFLRVIQQEGMSFTSPAGAIEDAQQVCASLADGMTGVQIGNQIIREAGLTGHQATVFVVEAAHAYCPGLMKQVLAEDA